jgi:hypothetical protein
MKSDILSFKSDLRADHDALQKQFDDFSQKGMGIVNASDMDTDLRDTVGSLNLLVEECIASIQTLDTRLQRRTQRVFDLENEIKVIRGENSVLKNLIEENGKSIYRNTQSHHALILRLCNSEDECKEQTAKCSNQHKQIVKNVDELKINGRDLHKHVKNIQCQIDDVNGPADRQTRSLRNEMRIMKDTVKSLNEDMSTHDHKINNTCKQVRDMKKKQKKQKKHSELVKEKSKLQKSFTSFVSEVHTVAQTLPEDSSSENSFLKDKRPNPVVKSHQPSLDDQTSNMPMSIAHGQPSDPNVSSSTHTIPTLVTQRHCSTPVNAAPTLPKATLVRRDIYIGNVSKQVPLTAIVQYMESRSFTVHTAFLVPNKRQDCNGAKLNISGTNRILKDNSLLPRGAYARNWHPARNNY